MIAGNLEIRTTKPLLCLRATAFISAIFAILFIFDHVSASPYDDALKQGRQLVDEDKCKQAIPFLDLSIKQNPNGAEAWAQRARAFCRLGNLQSALHDSSYAITLDSDLAIAYYSRGNVDSAMNKPMMAIQDFTKAIQLDPKYPRAYHQRGKAYQIIGQPGKAIEDWSKAIELDPKMAQSYVSRGYAYSSVRQFQKAIDDYNVAIELDPTNAYAFAVRGHAFGSIGQHQKAIDDISKAITLDPNSPNNAISYRNRGLEYKITGQHEKAIADCTRSIALDPRNTLAYNTRASCYMAKGQYFGALSDFIRMKMLDPNSERFGLVVLVCLSLGFAWLSRGRRQPPTSSIATNEIENSTINDDAIAKEIKASSTLVLDVVWLIAGESVLATFSISLISGSRLDPSSTLLAVLLALVFCSIPLVAFLHSRGLLSKLKRK